MFTVSFYTEADGSKPVGQFINSLDVKLRTKVVSDLNRLREGGNILREPYSKHLVDGIFELRSIRGNNIVRILYFYDRDKIIIATNGFVKKTQRTPVREIRLAMRRRKDYWSKNGRT